MAVTWSASLVNRIAPDLDSFSKAAIPDLSADFLQAPYWLQNYFLNTSFGGRFTGTFEPAVLGYLRRADHAFRAFHRARELTLEYVANFKPGQPRVRLYYDALDEWEMFVLQLQMAVDLRVYMEQENVFEPGDGSEVQRLYDMANAVKHLRGHIASKRFEAGDLLPLWLAPSGLRSFCLSASYLDAATVLRHVAILADKLQNPAAFVAEIASEDESDGAPAA